jgi:hypothetical protein
MGIAVAERAKAANVAQARDLNPRGSGGEGKVAEVAGFEPARGDYPQPA